MKKWSERKPSLHASARAQSGKWKPYRLFYHKGFYVRSWLKRNRKGREAETALLLSVPLWQLSHPELGTYGKGGSYWKLEAWRRCPGPGSPPWRRRALLAWCCCLRSLEDGPTRPVPRPLRTDVSQLVSEPLRRWDAAGSQKVEKNLKLELTA